MNICEECGKGFKTPQALGAHRVLYHRASGADLEALKADQRLKQEKIAELEAKHQAASCPCCGKLVSWDSLPLRECPRKSFERGNPEEWYLALGNVEMVKYRMCPVCRYCEAVEGQEPIDAR